MSVDRRHPQVGSDYTVSNRQCLQPHRVKQALLHSLLQCPNMDQFSNCWELVQWHFCSRFQTILVALYPRMVRVCKCVCLADPQTVRIHKKICGSGSADIRLRTPLVGGIEQLPQGQLVWVSGLRQISRSGGRRILCIDQGQLIPFEMLWTGEGWTQFS